jgi:hypothetical protein
MKRILMTLVLVGSLVFSLAACTMASSIYVDSLAGSSWKADILGSSNDGDLNGNVIGVEASSSRLTVGLEYLTGTEKSDSDGDSDFDTLYCKAGFKLSGDESSYTALTVGYDKLTFDNDDDTEFSGIIVGVAGVCNLSEKSQLEASLGYSISGTYSSAGSDQDITILLGKVKYSHFFTGNFGASVSYRYEKYDLDDVDMSFSLSGPTVGLIYRF